MLRMQKKSVDGIMSLKNREIKALKEQTQALEITNTIISAYLSVLVERLGGVRIPKREISAALGGFVTTAQSDGEDYVIKVEKLSPVGERGEE